MAVARGIDERAVARWRFRTLLLDGASAPDVATAVRHLAAVQAENLDQTGWALASRTTGLTPSGLADRIGAGELVRTHVLRPTWHLVHRDDLRWLMDVTGPRVRPLMTRQLERDLGIDGPTLATLTDVVVAALDRTPDLTRDQVAAAVRDAAHEVTGMQLMVVMAHAELGLLVASGTPTGDGTGSHTYRLVDDDLPPSPYADRDEALAGIARRYVLGHGPATERDLAYWATLPLGEVRRGIAAAAPDLGSFELDGRTFWHAAGEEPPPPSREPAVHLLHLLDEWYRGFQDSRRVVDVAGAHPVGREPSIGLAVVDAQVVGPVTRTVKPSTVAFELRPYRDLTAAERSALDAEVRRYGAYLDRDATLTVAG